MRLINAEALKLQIEFNQNFVNPKLNISDVLWIIDNAPTVEERPHGKWIEPFESNGKTYHKCNHCHISSELILFGNFCPNCGAQMSEEVQK